ncbi:MAG: imidazole glycerol phosphate synthase subunit HisF [Armatimonadetes bacterium]|nr:imidazole glycerol phosphate synthase subunit HisF [Armatimonadota bacterium]MDE2206696.1 imidazole glycerol phosphate synthase subunit HisF [Armatimonadota bacterium]
MLARRVIPCLDVRAGQVVKGVQFQDLRSAGDPVDLARRYDAAGADELVFLDITASHEERKTMRAWVEAVAEQVFIPFSVGGGVSSVGDFQILLRAGADKVAVNTAALARPDVIKEAAATFGSQCVVLAIDAKRRSGPGTAWEAWSHGGRRATGLDAVEWAQRGEALGAGEVLLTSMDRDGGKDGFDLALTRAVADAVSIPVIASGGAGSPADCVDAVLRGQADAVLVASIVHDGIFTVRQIKAAMRDAGIPVRMHAESPVEQGAD